MAKRTVYICDGKNCGHVLVNPEDGFIITGSIKNTAIENATCLVTTGSEEQNGVIVPVETALCRECMLDLLKLDVPA